MKRASVLVVDDDEIAARALRRVIENLGHRCVVAPDGARALEIVATSQVDIVFSDWRMPALDGLELCRAIRALGERYIYFILMTGSHERRGLLDAMRAGADDYLEKPLDIDTVEARLLCAQRVLHVHETLRQRNRTLRRDSQRFLEISRVDALTGVGNRRSLGDDLAVARDALGRYGTACAVAMCDVDHFKTYNDAFGHIAGDHALKQVVGAIERALRASDRVYRFGGEEFVVLLPEQDRTRARAAMERVRKAVERSAPVTISVGITELRRDDLDETAIERADEALYEAKRSGRNRVVVTHDVACTPY
jgi:diguanylate cyclase (GGDEF)-like protein